MPSGGVHFLIILTGNRATDGALQTALTSNPISDVTKTPQTEQSESQIPDHP